MDKCHYACDLGTACTYTLIFLEQTLKLVGYDPTSVPGVVLCPVNEVGLSAALALWFAENIQFVAKVLPQKRTHRSINGKHQS